MNISKGEYKMLKNMTDELMDAEWFINIIGVETRLGVTEDDFRPIADILTDIVTVSNNNPTLIKDAIGNKFATTDESDEFISKYNLDGIMSSCKKDITFTIKGYDKDFSELSEDQIDKIVDKLNSIPN